MRYVLDDKAFLAVVRKRGYKGVADFARRTGVHRNTVNYFLKGHSILSSSYERIASSLDVDPLEIVETMPDSASHIKSLDEIIPVVRYIVKSDPKIAVVLLGSRAMKKGHVHADWDIGITRGEKPIGGDEYLDLRIGVGDIAENLPHGVDLINLDAAPGWFLEEIRYEPVFIDGNRENFVHFLGVLNGIKKSLAA